MTSACSRAVEIHDFPTDNPNLTIHEEVQYGVGNSSDTTRISGVYKQAGEVTSVLILTGQDLWLNRVIITASLENRVGCMVTVGRHETSVSIPLFD